MAQDYYALLGISKGASADEIKKAFRKLAHQHHPDKAHGNEAKFKEINEAYQVLSDPKKRAQYDQFGQTFNSQGQPGGGQGFGGFGGGGGAEGFHFDFGGGGFDDIFSEVFGGGRQGGGRRRRGADVGVDVEITFEEMAHGVEKEIRLRKMNPCKICRGTGGKPGAKENVCGTCHGSGQIQKQFQSIFGSFAQAVVCPECSGKGKVISEKCPECRGAGRMAGESVIRVPIPAGIDHGATLQVSGEGEAGGVGESSGDLLVTVHVKKHATFERKGNDVIIKKNIDFPTAALGDSLPVMTLDGVVKIKIPAGTQSGDLFRLAGKGIESGSRWSGRGDAFVRVHVEVPKKLSRESRKLIEQLKALED